MSGDRKWISLSFITGALIIAWVLNQAFLLVVRYARVSNPDILGVLPLTAVVAAVVSGLFVFLYTRQAKVQSFCFEVLAEMKKVVWPQKKMVYMSTIVVLISVFIMASVLGLFDWACTSLIGLVLRV